MAFFGLFGKKKRTLRDLALDDLKREQITLEQEQNKIDREAERLDKDESQFKSEYAVATSETQKKSIARKIQSLRTRRKASQTKAAHCHKMLQTVNNFILIKDNMEFYEKMGVGSLLTDMDMAEVETFINEATVEGSLQQEKLASMLQQVTDGVEQITELTEGEGLDDIMAELDGETATESVDTADADLADVMTNLDAAIAQGEQAARKSQTPTQKEAEKET